MTLPLQVDQQKLINKSIVVSDGYKKILKDLKVSLYAKFGDNINLEADK